MVHLKKSRLSIERDKPIALRESTELVKREKLNFSPSNLQDQEADGQGSFVHIRQCFSKAWEFLSPSVFKIFSSFVGLLEAEGPNYEIRI